MSDHFLVRTSSLSQKSSENTFNFKVQPLTYIFCFFNLYKDQKYENIKVPHVLFYSLVFSQIKIRQTILISDLKSPLQAPFVPLQLYIYRMVSILQSVFPKIFKQLFYTLITRSCDILDQLLTVKLGEQTNCMQFIMAHQILFASANSHELRTRKPH